MTTKQVRTKDMSEAEARIVVGVSADYYLASWKGSGRVGLNLAAFGLPLFWLPYRKMHRETAIFFGLFLAELCAEELLRVGGNGQPEAARSLQVIMTLAVCCVCGAFGNKWYRTHVKRIIAAARLQEPDEAKRLALLATTGGASARLAFVWFLAFIFAVLCLPYVLKLVLGIHASY